MNTHSKISAAGTFKSPAQATRPGARTGTPRRTQLLLGAMALAAGAYVVGMDTAMAHPRYWLEYSFLGASSDGASPSNILAWGPNGQNANWLYGVTGAGGGGSCNTYGPTGCGTVYGLTPASSPYLGTEDWVASFPSTTGIGDNPQALVDVTSTLYGVTLYGGTGTDSGGTLYWEPATGGQPTIMYNFCSQANCADGSRPTALINVNGTLYGTTTAGGAFGYGTVFSVNLPNSTPTVLYSFRGQSTDGANPRGLAYDSANGALYGTTSSGGAHGGGMVFSIPVPCGACTETPLYNFCGRAACTDGQSPTTVYYDSANNTLYGTTLSGGGQGVSVCGGSGCGTVFSLSTSGLETVLHAFCSMANCADGIYPNGLDPDGMDAYGASGSITGLGNVNNQFYGTTFAGGTQTCPAESNQFACGVLFQIKTNGHFVVKHDFPGSGADGQNPYGPLTNVSGTLYGTTEFGGVSNWGMVFAYKS